MKISKTQEFLIWRFFAGMIINSLYFMGKQRKSSRRSISKSHINSGTEMAQKNYSPTSIKNPLNHQTKMFKEMIN
jgi:hypothetical protein